MKIINDCEKYNAIFPVIETESRLKGFGEFFLFDNMENSIFETNSYKMLRKAQKITFKGNSLAVQLLRLHTSTAGGTG